MPLYLAVRVELLAAWYTTKHDNNLHANTTHSAKNSKMKKSSGAKSDGAATIQNIPMNHDRKDLCTISFLKAKYPSYIAPNFNVFTTMNAWDSISTTLNITQ